MAKRRNARRHGPIRLGGDADEAPRAQVVRRLRGAAAGGKADRAAYREHLCRKYGGR